MYSVCRLSIFTSFSLFVLITYPARNDIPGVRVGDESGNSNLKSVVIGICTSASSLVGMTTPELTPQ